MNHYKDSYAGLPVRPADPLPDTYGEVYEIIESELKETHPMLVADRDVAESVIDSLATTFMGDYDLGATINTYDPNVAEELILDVEDFLEREDIVEYIESRIAEGGVDETPGKTYGDYDSFGESAKPRRTGKRVTESEDEADEDEADEDEEDFVDDDYANFDFHPFEKKAEEEGPLSEEEMEDLLVKMYRFIAMANEATEKFNDIQDSEEAEDSDYFKCMGDDINSGVAQNVTDCAEEITNIMGY